MTHPSERSDLGAFTELGLDTDEWHAEMQRPGVPLAPWMDPGAWGETFEVVSAAAAGCGAAADRCRSCPAWRGRAAHASPHSGSRTLSGVPAQRCS